MDCARARKLMALTIGGDVTAATREAVESHASACPGCRAEYASYRKAAEALSSLSGVPEPPGGWGGLWAGIAERLPETLRRGGEPAAESIPRTSDVPAAPATARPTRPRLLRLVRFAAVLLVGFAAGFVADRFWMTPSPGGPRSSPPFAGTAAPRPSGIAPSVKAAWRDRVGAVIGRRPDAAGGWRVCEVLPGKPADLSGLRLDDVLQSVEGADLPDSLDDLAAVLSRLAERREVRLQIMRGGVVNEVILKLRPE